MTPYEYMLKTRETAIYPKELAVPYLTLGLISEIDELDRELRGGHYRDLSIAKESGDILWYVFRLHDELNLPNDKNWGDYWNWYHNGHVPFREATSIIYGNSSQLAGIIKKAIRDNNNQVPSDKLPDVTGLLSIIVAMIAQIDHRLSEMDGVVGTEYDMNLEYVASRNIEKLQSRKSRNVIGGSGDER